MVRRLFLTPSELPEGSICRPLEMPDSQDWLAVFSEALSQTIYAYNYEQIDPADLTPEQAAAAAYSVYTTWLEAVCGAIECPPPSINNKRVVRQNPDTYAWEQVNDTGDGWEELEGDIALPPLEQREELTEDERLCAAATNAINTLRLLYVTSLQMYEDNLDPAGAFDLFADYMGELVSLAFGILLGHAWPVIGQFWTLLYGAMEILTTEMWSEAWDDTLICLLKDNASEDGSGLITFDWQAFNQGLFLWQDGQPNNLLLALQTFYFSLIIGPDGLNLAGQTTAVVGDCGSCGTWTHTINTLDWAVITKGTLTAPPAYDIWVATSGGNQYWYDFTLTFDTTACQVDRVSFYHQQQSTTTTQHISVSPASVSWQHDQSLVGGGPLVVDTGTPVAGRYSNSDETTIRIWQDVKTGSFNSQVNYVTVSGTGVNPFL